MIFIHAKNTNSNKKILDHKIIKVLEILENQLKIAGEALLI